MIGTNSYPMKNTPKMTNRWEALVPVPTPAPELRYRIKVNWKYNAIPAPWQQSVVRRNFACSSTTNCADRCFYHQLGPDCSVWCRRPVWGSTGPLYNSLPGPV